MKFNRLVYTFLVILIGFGVLLGVSIPTTPIVLAGKELPIDLPTLDPNLQQEAQKLWGLGGAHWIVEIDVPQSMGIASSAADLERQVKNIIPANTPIIVRVFAGNSPNGPVYTIYIEGNNVDLMKLIVFELLTPVIDVSGQQILYTLSGAVAAGDTLEIFLSGIPSTGSKWLIDELGDLFRLTSDDYECEEVGPGAGKPQTLLLDILKDGMAIIELTYQRAWEDFLQYFPVRITIEYGNLSGTLDLSDPTLLENITKMQELPQADLKTVGSIPSSFDWSTSNNFTGAPQMSAVKNQGNCGSCWAFATVGVMEGVMMIEGLGEKDLSEQYLVSCNSDGWSCNGGWMAHQYHINKNGLSSNNPGAVRESDMPYAGADTSCPLVADHPWLLSSQVSVDNDVDTLKTALYELGPLFTTICSAPKLFWWNH